MRSSSRPSLPMVYIEMDGIASPRIALYVKPESTVRTLIQQYQQEVSIDVDISSDAKLIKRTQERSSNASVKSIENVSTIKHNDVLAISPCAEVRGRLLKQRQHFKVKQTTQDKQITPGGLNYYQKNVSRLKRKERSMSGRLRTISSMAKTGFISNEDKGRLKDLVVTGYRNVEDALDSYMESKTSTGIEKIVQGAKQPRPRGVSKDTEYLYKYAIEHLSTNFSDMDVAARRTRSNSDTKPLSDDAKTQQGPPGLMRSKTYSQSPSNKSSPKVELKSVEFSLSKPPVARPVVKKKGRERDSAIRPSLAALSPEPFFGNPGRPHLDGFVSLGAESLLLNRLKGVHVDRDFYAEFEIHETLGSGKYSVVYRSISRATGEHYAAKVIDKAKVFDPKYLVREIEILHSISHSQIVTLVELYESETEVILVMELCGQELFLYIDRQGCLKEREARVLIRSLLDAVAYLHGNDIVHRDIKPENILLNRENDISSIKLTDFGIARRLHGDFVQSPMEFFDVAADSNSEEVPLTRPRLGRAHTKCGTRDYVAPEVMQGTGYNTQADMWSLGVVTHVILCGHAPIYLPDAQGELNVSFEDEQWQSRSSQVKDFITQLLRRNPDIRINAIAAQKHPWIVVDH